MGVVLVPLLLYWLSTWLRDGQLIEDQGARPRSRIALALYSLGVVFVGGLGSAVLASVLVRYLGWLGGAAAFAVLLALIGLRKGGVLHFFYDRLLAWPRAAT